MHTITAALLSIGATACTMLAAKYAPPISAEIVRCKSVTIQTANPSCLVPASVRSSGHLSATGQMLVLPCDPDLSMYVSRSRQVSRIPARQYGDSGSGYGMCSQAGCSVSFHEPGVRCTRQDISIPFTPCPLSSFVAPCTKDEENGLRGWVDDGWRRFISMLNLFFNVSNVYAV